MACAIHWSVVFQKWRWTVINVTLGLIFVASLRKEWPMTFIAVRCPYCQSDQIVKRGKTARGTQRYLCQGSCWIPGAYARMGVWKAQPVYKALEKQGLPG